MHSECHLFLYVVIMKLMSTFLKIRLKQHVGTGPRDGPYMACMKYSEVQHILQQKYPEISQYDVRKVIAMAFPDAQSERSTYILGIRRRFLSPTATEMSSTLSPISQHVACTTLAEENARLQERVSQLEAEVQSLQQSSVPLSVIQQQLDQLTSSNGIIMCGPDTLEHLESFTIDSVLEELRTNAPDLLQLFETLGQTSRNVHGDDLAVEQVKSLVSICTLLNARTRRAKGLQLLISIMLIARSTSKQVNGRFNQSGINPYLKV